MAKHVYDNLVQDQNRVAHPNIIWSMDLFHITLNSNQFVSIYFAIDVFSNEIIAYCVGLNKIVSSNRICSALQSQIELREPELQRTGKVILHSDRGSQFTSQIYFNFVTKKDQWVVASMSEPYSPKRNAVAERFVRTFKNTKLNGKTLQETFNDAVKTQKKFNSRLIVDKFVVHLNKKKNKKANQPKTANLKARAALAINPLPKHRQAFSVADPRLDYIEQFKIENEITYSQMEKAYSEMINEPLDQQSKDIILQVLLGQFLNIFKYSQAQNLIQLQQIHTQVDEIQSDVTKILDAVTPATRKQRALQPLRDPVLNSTYLALMENAGVSFKRQTRLKQAQLRLLYTVAYFTGCRINEASRLNSSDFIKLKTTGKIYLIHHKTKTKHVHVIADTGIQQLKRLEPEFNLIFIENQYHCLFGKTENEIHHPLSIIRTVNRDIKNTCELNNWIGLNLKSHSFRVGFITELLKNNDLLLTSQIVGHNRVESTQKYNRYTPNSEKIKDVLNQTFTDI